MSELVTVPRTTTLPVYGEVECWELAGVHEGRRLVCNSPRTFLHYLASKGTVEAKSRERCVGSWVDLEATGPMADDGEHLSVRFRLTKEDFAERVSGAEQAVMLRLLAEFAPEGCQPYRDGAKMVRDCLMKGYTRL